GTPYFDETGINYEDAANVNIWFGDVENYEDKDFICDNRGSFLYGKYKITELQSSKNEGMDMLGKEFTITKDNDTVTPDGVMVDLEVVFTSEALDVRTDSTNLTIGSKVTIDDTVNIEHLKSYIETADGEKEYLKYKIETEIVNVKKDGTKVSLGTFEPKHITYDNHGRVVESEDNTFMPEVYDNPDNDLDPTRTTYVHDFVLRSTGIDTSNVEPGSYVAVIDHVYQWDSTNKVWTHIVTHNKDCTEESQKLYAPDINTLATNNSTKTRVASLDPKTKASDIISYEGLGEGNDYVFTIKLVDDDNNIIKDVNDNDCVITTTLHTQAKDSNGNLLDSVYYVPSGNYLLGPGTASFKFDEVGFEPFEIPNDVINMHFVVSASNSVFDSTVGDIVSDAILSHNADLTDELEVIRRPQFTTLASSVDGYTNQMLPCDKEVSIKDTLSYTNLAETIEVKVVSKATVVKINDETVDKSLLNKVVLTSENYATLEQAVGTTKSTEVILDSFDTTPYAGTTLSVSSKIYMVVDGQDVLIGNHNEDNTDESEWVAIPKIGTTAYNTSDGRNYKVISREYADVTLTDYVNFTTIEGNKAWTFTATLMDKVTEEPVKDANGNIVTKDVTFTPLTDENVIISKRETINGVEMVSGTYPVPITFTQVLKSYDWEEAEEPWVIFEDIKPHTPGHTEVKYAVHNDLEDDKQTVTHPLFRTTVANTKTGLKNVAATDNQSVTDTVEFKYFKQAVKEGDKFTLVIEAHNAADGSPILDKDGKVYTNSKVFTYKGQKSEDIELTFDATGFEGQTIVFYETLYYGENKFEDKYKVLVEDDNTLAEQSVTIPEIHTTAVDVVSNSHTLTFDKKIKDVVDMKGIAPNTEYKLITKIFDKDTNSIVKDSNGKDVIWENNYTSGDANTEGTIHHEEVSHIEYKTSDGEQFVTEREAIAHIDDAGLTDDTIEEVKVVDVEEGDETVIIPAVSDTVTVNMDLSKLDANTFKSIEGHDIVIYEYLYMVKYPDTPYAAHTDKNDKDQTIEIPEVHTELLDGGNLTHEVALAGEEITLVDTVYYSNLLVGESYEIKGVLMDKDKKEPLKDANGKIVEGKATLKDINNPNGQAKITFTVNADVLTNLMITKDDKGNSVYTATPKDIVAFETLTTYAIEGETTKIYTYSKEEDLSDKDQTVTVPNPTTHTTIKDAADNDNVIDGTKKNQTIIDTVYYDNLIVGKEYTVTGKLVVKSRNGELITYETDEKGEIINPEYVKDANGKIVTASTTFKPTKSTGTVDVVFENIDTTLYAGTKIVGFESVKYGDIEVMSHNDINDESQTLTISLQLHAQIAKADNDNVKYYLKGAEITIWKMQYTDKDGNPVPISQVNEDNSGKYAVTQKVATDINGNECKGLTDENGMVNYTVLFDETAKYYAQETKAPDGYLINSNMFEITPTGEKESDGVDLIKISVLDKRITRRPKTGDTTPIMLLIAFICMGTLGGIGLLLTGKKKNGAKVTNVNTNVTNADDAEITEKQDE
ncbi:MAG: VaFE repeat-containing surface-anchored protein, partial [Bacilli bacterium]|nr:VaFE repeat-containing surface-anchored protein [Bacilli bacterium]